MTNPVPVLSDDEVASLIAEVGREQKSREYDCCAYRSKSGKSGCGTLRYYHDNRVKSHAFAEPQHTSSRAAKMLALHKQNTALREQLAARTIELEREGREMQKWNNRANQIAIEKQELQSRLAQVTQENEKLNAIVSVYENGDQEALEEAENL